MTSRRHRDAHRTGLPLWAASSALLLATAAAHAQPQLNKFTTYMHAGPGKDWAVLDEIPANTTIDVQGCGQGWCRVRYGGAWGWVTMSVLSDRPAITYAQAGAKPLDCFEFVRSGWPDGGDLFRLCIYPPTQGTAAAPASKPE